MQNNNGNCDSDDDYGDCTDYDSGDADASFSDSGGYRFGPYFALEFGYLNAGSPQWRDGFAYVPGQGGVFDNDVDLNLEAAQLSVVGILPFMSRWEAYVKGGASYWSADADQRFIRSVDGRFVARRVDDEDVGLLIALGIGYSVTPQWHVRVEFQTFDISSDLVNAPDDTTLDSVHFELQYRPGWSGGGSAF